MEGSGRTILSESTRHSSYELTDTSEGREGQDEAVPGTWHIYYIFQSSHFMELSDM